MRWSLLLLFTACVTSTPAAPPPIATWEVPLELEAGGLPLVEVVVAGKPTRLVVDTASSETWLATWFATSLGVPVEGGKTSDLTLSIGSNALPAAKWSVRADPGDFQALGIGGVLAPHHLVERGAVALDFPRKRLLLLTGQMNVWMRWLDERSPSSAVESLPRAGERDGTLHVKSRVGDGKRELVTQLASGSKRSEYLSEFFDASLIGEGGAVKGLHVRLGDSEFGPIDVTARPKLGSNEGVLGMDVLSKLVLLMPAFENQALWVMTPRE